jgi:hypothetical protein
VLKGWTTRIWAIFHELIWPVTLIKTRKTGLEFFDFGRKCFFANAEVDKKQAQ